MEYGSVIFDMDGVILNSMSDDTWKYRATENALAELGVDQSLGKDVLDSILGDDGYAKCVKVCGDVGVDPRKAWNLVAEKTSRARMQQIEQGSFGLCSDVDTVLTSLRESQMKLGVISNAPDQAVEMMINHFDLRNYFKFYMGVRSFEDLKARKPHPNHLELAKFQLKRDPYVYVGDHMSDVEAASNAGMDSIWIHEKESSEPTYRVDELKSILDIVDDS